MSHSHVPSKPRESRLCGKCGWLLSCDYSLTKFLSHSLTHSSSVTPSFHVNHPANLMKFIPTNAISLPDHGLTEGANITNTTSVWEKHDISSVCQLAALSHEDCVLHQVDASLYKQKKASRLQRVVLLLLC